MVNLKVIVSGGQGQGLPGKGHKGTFWAGGNMSSLLMGVALNICLKTVHYLSTHQMILKICHLTVCQFYVKKKTY